MRAGEQTLNFSTSSEALAADGNSESFRNGIGIAVHLVGRFGLYHYTREQFRAGVAHDDAAISVKVLLGAANRGSDVGHISKRFLLAHANVLDDLRKNFEIGNQLSQRLSGFRNDLEHPQRGEQA